ncbi:MAG: hypothetical protein WCI05_08875 [Myxococcales bacterium]
MPPNNPSNTDPSSKPLLESGSSVGFVVAGLLLLLAAGAGALAGELRRRASAAYRGLERDAARQAAGNCGLVGGVMLLRASPLLARNLQNKIEAHSEKDELRPLLSQAKPVSHVPGSSSLEPSQVEAWLDGATDRLLHFPMRRPTGMGADEIFGLVYVSDVELTDTPSKQEMEDFFSQCPAVAVVRCQLAASTPLQSFLGMLWYPEGYAKVGRWALLGTVLAALVGTTLLVVSSCGPS